MSTLRNRKLWLVAGLVLAVGAALLAFWSPGGRADGRDLLQDGMVQIGQSRVAVDRAFGSDVFQASLGPAPEFDTGALGVEQPLDRTPVGPPPNVSPPAVLIGSNRLIDENHETGAMFYYAEPAAIVDRLTGLFSGDPAVQECLQSANGGMCGSGPIAGGRPSVASTVSDDEALPVELEWYALPEDTSVIVVLGDDGEPLFWQRPAARLGLLSVPMGVGDRVRLEARDSGGDVLAADTFTRCDYSNPDAPPQC